MAFVPEKDWKQKSKCISSGGQWIFQSKTTSQSVCQMLFQKLVSRSTLSTHSHQAQVFTCGTPPRGPVVHHFHRPLCWFVSFPAVLLCAFFSDTEFCICQCINTTRTVKIFCLAAGLGSSNQLGPLVMMGWRRQPKPRAYKCSQGLKILLAAQAPSDSVCLNYRVFHCACAGLVWFASYFWGEWDLKNHFCDADKASTYLGSWGWAAQIEEVERSLVNRPCGCGRAAWGVWQERSCRRAQLPAPRLWLWSVFTAVMKVALLAQLHLQPCSASTVKYGPAQLSRGWKAP